MDELTPEIVKKQHNYKIYVSKSGQVNIKSATKTYSVGFNEDRIKKLLSYISENGAHRLIQHQKNELFICWGGHLKGKDCEYIKIVI